MSGCARSCLLWALGWGGASAGFYFFLLRFGGLEPAIWWAAGGAGLCATICFSYLVAIRAAARERSMLLDAIAGTPPRDGAWTAVSGHIRSVTPLRTPLSGQSAVAYDYKIFRMERSGKSSSEVRYFEGKALAPSTIATRQGTLRLLAVPTLDVKPEEVDDRSAVANAEQYIGITQFQSLATPKKDKIGMEQESTDDDGNFRLDKRGTDREVDLNDCQFEEKSIKQGEMVCAFGLYSQQRGGLIPHPNWAKQGRIMRGDATEVAGQLRTRIIKYGIGVIVFAAAIYGIVKLNQRNVPAAETSALTDHLFIVNRTVRVKYESTASPRTEPGVKRHWTTASRTAALKGAIAAGTITSASRTRPFLSMMHLTTTVADIPARVPI